MVSKPFFENGVFLPGPPTGGAHRLQVYYARSASAGTRNLFRQIPSADLQLFQEADGVAEIWKVLNNLLVEGTGEGEEGRKGGREGRRMKEGREKWGMGEQRNRIQNCSYTALCLALLPLHSHTHTHTHINPPTSQNTHTHIQTTPHTAPAFFFYVCSTILQVLFFFFFNGS